MRSGDEDFKLKPVVDSDVRVIGFNGPSHRIKSLQVCDMDGNEFAVSAGLTEQARRNPPALGSVVTFAFTGRAKLKLPRHPRLLHVRCESTFV